MEPVSDQDILQAIEEYSLLHEQGTLVNLLAFARVLKKLGLKVGLSQVIDTSRCLERIEIGNRTDFYATLRCNLVSAKEDLDLFERTFDLFWRSPEAMAAALEAPGVTTSGADAAATEPAQDTEEVEVAIEASDEEEAIEGEAQITLPTYSPTDSLQQKDFSEMDVLESRAISRAILLIATKIATQVSRRKRRALRGNEVDPRWSMRKSIRHGGDMMELVFRKRRIKKTRVVLLCDVSGSMDCYSRFLIQFMYGLQNELWGVETFVFSTSLTRITHLIRTRDIENALARISQSVLGWSGGTNIGRSLESFNREFAPSLVTHRTVVVIISDGWDRGDVALLEREMGSLKRRCHKIIWLNPLLASENYEPLCKGMQAALPYLDFFLSVHNLNSLVVLGQKLQKLAA
jgi:uncharacterized protein